MEEERDFGRRKVWRTETRMEDGSCWERERRKTRKSESETRAGKLKSGGAKRRRRLLPPSKPTRHALSEAFLFPPRSSFGRHVGGSQPFARHGRFVHTYRNYRYRRTVTSAYNTADSRLPFVPQRSRR